MSTSPGWAIAHGRRLAHVAARYIAAYNNDGEIAANNVVAGTLELQVRMVPLPLTPAERRVTRIQHSAVSAAAVVAQAADQNSAMLGVALGPIFTLDGASGSLVTDASQVNAAAVDKAVDEFQSSTGAMPETERAAENTSRDAVTHRKQHAPAYQRPHAFGRLFLHIFMKNLGFIIFIPDMF